MAKIGLTLLGVLAVWSGMAARAAADAPAIIPLQGFLQDASGEPVDGVHRLTFSLYDAASDGRALYTDDWLSVDVDNGYFVVYLGNQEDEPLDLALFRDNQDLWIEVIIDGEEIVQPRTYLASVPHAGFAQYCGEAQTLGGRPASDLVPAGALMPFAGREAPAGWLIADGSSVSRETYAALFAAIGVVYGEGDGSTTFRLPDLRGRAAVGAGAGADLTERQLGASFGSETHALSAAELPGHTHAGMTAAAGGHSHTTSNEGAHSHTGTTSSGNAVWYRTVGGCDGTATDPTHIRGWGGCDYLDRNDTSYPMQHHTHNFTSDTAGAHGHAISSEAHHQHGFTTDSGAGLSGAGHPIVQPSVALTYIIKH
jgi:microcystin-dependent protein